MDDHRILMGYSLANSNNTEMIMWYDGILIVSNVMLGVIVLEILIMMVYEYHTKADKNTGLFIDNIIFHNGSCLWFDKEHCECNLDQLRPEWITGTAPKIEKPFTRHYRESPMTGQSPSNHQLYPRKFDYPLVNIQKAMENGHRNSGFSHEKWWIFPWQNVSSPEGKPYLSFHNRCIRFIHYSIIDWPIQYYLTISKPYLKPHVFYPSTVVMSRWPTRSSQI